LSTAVEVPRRQVAGAAGELLVVRPAFSLLAGETGEHLVDPLLLLRARHLRGDQHHGLVAVAVRRDGAPPPVAASHLDLTALVGGFVESHGKGP
jgi:hypothetical protein